MGTTSVSTAFWRDSRSPFGFALEFLQAGFGELQERLVVVLQGVGGEGLKGFPQFGRSRDRSIQFLGRRLSFMLQRGLQCSRLLRSLASASCCRTSSLRAAAKSFSDAGTSEPRAPAGESAVPARQARAKQRHPEPRRQQFHGHW